MCDRYTITVSSTDHLGLTFEIFCNWKQNTNQNKNCNNTFFCTAHQGLSRSYLHVYAKPYFMTCSQTNQLNGISIVVWSFLYIFKLFTIQSTSPCYCMFVWRTILLNALNFCVEKVLLTINPYQNSMITREWKIITQFCFDEQGLDSKKQS